MSKPLDENEIDFYDANKPYYALVNLAKSPFEDESGTQYSSAEAMFQLRGLDPKKISNPQEAQQQTPLLNEILKKLDPNNPKSIKGINQEDAKKVADLVVINLHNSDPGQIQWKYGQILKIANPQLDTNYRNSYITDPDPYPDEFGDPGEPARAEVIKEVRDQVMFEIQLFKFSQNPDLAELLLSTGEKNLHETAGNRDTYWGKGTVQNPGRDKLGKILMLVRKELRQELAIYGCIFRREGFSQRVKYAMQNDFTTLKKSPPFDPQKMKGFIPSGHLKDAKLAKEHALARATKKKLEEHLWKNQQKALFYEELLQSKKLDIWKKPHADSSGDELDTKHMMESKRSLDSGTTEIDHSEIATGNLAERLQDARRAKVQGRLDGSSMEIPPSTPDSTPPMLTAGIPNKPEPLVSPPTPEVRIQVTREIYDKIPKVESDGLKITENKSKKDNPSFTIRRVQFESNEQEIKRIEDGKKQAKNIEVKLMEELVNKVNEKYREWQQTLQTYNSELEEYKKKLDQLKSESQKLKAAPQSSDEKKKERELKDKKDNLTKAKNFFTNKGEGLLYFSGVQAITPEVSNARMILYEINSDHGWVKIKSGYEWDKINPNDMIKRPDGSTITKANLMNLKPSEIISDINIKLKELDLVKAPEIPLPPSEEIHLPIVDDFPHKKAEYEYLYSASSQSVESLNKRFEELKALDLENKLQPSAKIISDLVEEFRKKINEINAIKKENISSYQSKYEDINKSIEKLKNLINQFEENLKPKESKSISEDLATISFEPDSEKSTTGTLKAQFHKAEPTTEDVDVLFDRLKDIKGEAEIFGCATPNKIKTAANLYLNCLANGNFPTFDEKSEKFLQEEANFEKLFHEMNIIMLDQALPGSYEGPLGPLVIKISEKFKISSGDKLRELLNESLHITPKTSGPKL